MLLEEADFLWTDSIKYFVNPVDIRVHESIVLP